MRAFCRYLGLHKLTSKSDKISYLTKQELTLLLSDYIEIQINSKRGTVIDILNQLPILALRGLCDIYELQISNHNNYLNKTQLCEILKPKNIKFTMVLKRPIKSNKYNKYAKKQYLKQQISILNDELSSK